MSARGRTLQAHRFLHVALAALVAWQPASLAGVDRGAQVTLGPALHAVGLMAGVVVVLVGETLSLAGAAVYAGLLAGLLWQMRRR